MLTSPDASIIRDDRPAYRPYRASVTRVVKLSPSFRRITFTSDEFSVFGTDRLDQRIKILFPLAGRGITDVGSGSDWYARWRELPDEVRNPFRTYTVRDIRPDLRELDVDFVSHGDGGPAARWLSTATENDEVVIVGPDARSLNSSSGIDWRPGSATELLLVGDETAVPAICSIVESLPATARVTAFVSIATSADILPIQTDATLRLTWLPRDESGATLDATLRAWAAVNGELMRSALAHDPQPLEEIDVDTQLLWDSPAESRGSFYAWIAGESSMVKILRRVLVSEVGVDRSRVAFMGYWRLGKAESQ